MLKRIESNLSYLVRREGCIVNKTLEWSFTVQNMLWISGDVSIHDAGQVRSGQVRSGQVRSGQVRSGHTRSLASVGALGRLLLLSVLHHPYADLYWIFISSDPLSSSSVVDFFVVFFLPLHASPNQPVFLASLLRTRTFATASFSPYQAAVRTILSFI